MTARLSACGSPLPSVHFRASVAAPSGSGVCGWISKQSDTWRVERPVGPEDPVGYPVVVVEVAVGKEDAGAGRAAHAHDALRQAGGTDDLVRYDDGTGAPAVSRGRARRKSGPRLKAAEDGLMGRTFPSASCSRVQLACLSVLVAAATPFCAAFSGMLRSS